MRDTEDLEIPIYEEHQVKTGESLESIAEQYGLAWQDLTRFNFGTDEPNEVNHCLHAYIGCTQRTKDRKNYVFSDDDKPGIIYVPKAKLDLKVSSGKSYLVRLVSPVLYSRVEVQTVDDFGHRLGNVDLVLHSPKGLPDVKLHTGADGYATVDKVIVGKYQILKADGEPVFFADHGTSADAPAEDNDGAPKLVKAVLDTRLHSRAITRVICPGTATESELQERAVAKQIYTRTNDDAKLEGRGEETAAAPVSSAWYCADNLALAAGWTAAGDAVDLKGLVSKILRGYLRDYHSTAIARGYYVLLLEPQTRRLTVMSEKGSVEGTFSLAEGVELKGLLGAYGMFEDVAGEIFVDLATLSTTVGIPSNPTGGVAIEELVTDPEGLVALADKHPNQVQILYYTPTAQQLVALALLGGTGRFEDYGHDEKLNDAIHQRNLAVCRTIQAAYDAYFTQYIDKVKQTEDEKALRKLGPPRSPFEMPIPAGSSTQRTIDLFSALKTKEFDAWASVAHQLDKFANRMSQGFPYLRIKPKFVANPKTINKIKNHLRPGIPDLSDKLPGEVEVEFNFDFQIIDGDIHVISKADAAIKLKVPLDGVVKAVTKSGVPVEVSFKQSVGSPDKRSLAIKAAKYQIELDTSGKAKLSAQVFPSIWVDSEMNAHTGVFGGGITFKGKELAQKVRAKGPKYEKWASVLETLEVQVQVGLVGTREETILATVSNAPGFFERRSLEELLHPKTQWANLNLDEQRALANLGWHAAIWDGKYHSAFADKLPESLKKTFYEFTAEERVAIVHLGFYAYEDYPKAFRKAAGKHGKEPTDMDVT